MYTGMAFPRLPAATSKGATPGYPRRSRGAQRGDRGVPAQAAGQVDSWVPWLEDRAAADPASVYYELPTIVPRVGTGVAHDRRGDGGRHP